MLCEDTNFHVACTSNPDMSLESVKHSPDWSCDGRMVGRVQKRVSPEFSTRWFVSCVRTQVHMTVCFFVLICLHAPLRTWTTNELRPSLHTQVHEEYTHFWRKMVPTLRIIWVCFCVHYLYVVFCPLTTRNTTIVKETQQRTLAHPVLLVTSSKSGYSTPRNYLEWEKAARAVMQLFGPPGVAFSYPVIIKSMKHMLYKVGI